MLAPRATLSHDPKIPGNLRSLKRHCPCGFRPFMAEDLNALISLNNREIKIANNFNRLHPINTPKLRWVDLDFRFRCKRRCLCGPVLPLGRPFTRLPQ